MPFQPGQSGNPGGMHKGTAELKALARQHAASAIETLANIMHDQGAPPPARVAAANSLLDRGFGKPVQEVTGADGVPLLGCVTITFRPSEAWSEHKPDEPAA
jgi:hypothetical protein